MSRRQGLLLPWDKMRTAQTLINLITRVGGKNNIRRWMDELIKLETMEETMETMTATHTILCEMEMEWMPAFAQELGVLHEGRRLLCTEEQYKAIRKLTSRKLANIGKKIGYSYKCQLVECLNFEGKILSPEEKAEKEKRQLISNMNADELKNYISNFKFKNVTLMKEGGDVVEIYLQQNTNVEDIMQKLWDEYIPFQMSPSGNRIQCSGKSTRIRDAYKRLRAENAARPWFKPTKE